MSRTNEVHDRSSNAVWKKRMKLVPFLLIIVLTIASCSKISGSTPTAASNPTMGAPQLALARQKIKHIVIIMQENRSFDHYFGTYPGADGIPMQNGVPTVCVPDPATKTCVRPFHDTRNLNAGGPHGQADARVDIDGGKMDGFVRRARNAR